MLGHNRSSGQGSVQTRRASDYPRLSAPAVLLTEEGCPQYRLKRLLDVLVAGTALVVAVPLMLVIGAVLMFDSGWPVLFRPQRLGRGGRLFTMYKFRSMVPDAAARLEALSHLNVGVGMIKIPDDPRVTRVGSWLRRYSMDELPQLWNILRGDMSIVGPRPHDPTDIVPEELQHRVRLAVRPGLTGLWQVSARTDPSLEARVRYDLDYLESACLGLDLNIMFRTLGVVVRGNGGRVHMTLTTGAEVTSAVFGGD